MHIGQVQASMHERWKQARKRLNPQKSVDDEAFGPRILSLDDVAFGPIVHPRGTPKIAEIIEAVCNEYRVSRNELLSPRQEWRTVRPRQVAIWLAKTLTRHSLPEIGRQFEDRHHTTILHSVRRIDALKEKDPELAGVLQSLEKQLVASVKPRDATCSSSQTPAI